MSRKRKMLGSIDLLGLGDYAGGTGMNPIWGTVIGGGVAGVAGMAARHAATPGGTINMNAELVGLGAGVAAGTALFAFRSTRHAAIPAVLGAFLASGLAYLEKILLGTVQLPVATAQVASAVVANATAAAAGAPATAVPSGTNGLGIAQMRRLNGLGMSTMRPLNGLGIATMQNVPHATGTIPGVAGLRAAPSGQMSANLLGGGGRPQTQAGRHVSLMGGPNTQGGVAAMYGATLFGGGRG